MLLQTLPFVGRQVELDALKFAASNGANAVIVGAAGIGKSRLVAELAAGVDLICSVGVGAVELKASPYGVFRVLALQWGRLLDPRSLGWPAEQLEQLGPIFPGLRGGRSGEADVGDGADELWLVLLGYLDALVSSQPKPLALIVDDLDAVDEASVRLFAWLASQPLDLAVVATTGPNVPTPVAKLPRMDLGPIGLDSIGELVDIAQIPIAPEALRGITDGVPLRLHEWVLGASVPGAAHARSAVLDGLLDGADPMTLDVINLSAVFAGPIDTELLALVLDATDVDVGAALAEGSELGVLERDHNRTRGFHLDTHGADLRDRLDIAERRGLARRLLDGLLGQLADRPELHSHLADLATALGGDSVQAIELHLAAGHHAMSERDASNARDHFETAMGLAETTLEAGLLLCSTLALGVTLASMSDPGAPAVLSRVFPLAEDAGDADSFAHAALASPVGSGHVGLAMTTDHLAVARLRSALAMTTSPALRARVLTALAVQQHSSLAERDYFTLVDEAQEIADGLSDAELDVQLLAARLGPRRPFEEPSGFDERVVSRLEPFAPEALAAFDLAVTVACRAGELGRADELLRQYADESDPRTVVARWSVLRARTALAFARGSIDVARKVGLEALHVATGSRLDVVALDCFAFQIAAMLRERRKLPDARPTIETWVLEQPSLPAFRASRALMYAELDDLDAAQFDLEVFFAQDLVELRSRSDGPASIAMAIQAAFVVAGDGERRGEVQEWCRRGHELLAPLGGEWLLTGQLAVVDGPIVRVLALASAGLGHTDRAVLENAEAQRVAQHAGALLFVAHALRDQGLILRDAGRTDEACVALDQATGRYRSIGLTQQVDWLERQIAELRTSASESAVGARSNSSTRAEFRRDQEGWHVGFDDEATKCVHLKGMSMIAVLISGPDRSVSAGVLAAIGDDMAPGPEHAAIRAQSAQPLVDEQASAEYRRRLDRILVELGRADRAGDVTRSERLSDEFDAITAELTSTTGLGGRRRNMATEDERARVRVNKSIRLAIRRIGEQAPELAKHLELSIVTGRFCSYRSDRQHTVEWTLR